MKLNIFGHRILTLILTSILISMPTILGALAARPLVAGLILPSQEWQKIDQGKIYTKLIRQKSENLGKVYVIGLIDAKRSRVWDTLVDIHHLKRIYPNILELQIKQQHTHSQLRYTKLNFPWPLADRWELSLIKFNKSLWQESWQRKEGSILVDSGQWQLDASGSHTLMVYWTRINPGLNFVPEWAIRQGMQINAPDVIRKLRKYLKNKS